MESNLICETPWCPAALKRGDAWSMDGLEMIRVIAETHLSTVAICQYVSSGLRVAVKMYHKERLTGKMDKQVEREIKLHSRVQHESIISLYAAFQDAEGIYLVLECAAGDVHKLLGTCGGYLPESAALQQVMRPSVSAIAYLHAQGILHRDIKPENLLLTADGQLRLCDFGLALDLTCETPRSCVGTLDYMPPEMAQACLVEGSADVSYGFPADIWALGILACELLMGASPFEGDTKEETYAKILAGKMQLPSYLSSEARDFIHKAIMTAPEKRAAAAELLAHPWLKA